MSFNQIQSSKAVDLTKHFWKGLFDFLLENLLSFSFSQKVAKVLEMKLDLQPVFI